MIRTPQVTTPPSWRQRFEYQVQQRLTGAPQRLVITCDDANLRQQIIPLLFEDGSLVAQVPAARIPTDDSQSNREFWDELAYAVNEYALREIVIMGHSQCSYFPTPLQQLWARNDWEDQLTYRCSLAEQTRQVQEQLVRTQQHVAHQLSLLQDAIQLNGLNRRGFNNIARNAWYFLHESQWLLQYDAVRQEFYPFSQAGV